MVDELVKSNYGESLRVFRDKLFWLFGVKKGKLFEGFTPEFLTFSPRVKTAPENSLDSE